MNIRLIIVLVAGGCISYTVSDILQFESAVTSGIVGIVIGLLVAAVMAPWVDGRR